MSELPSTRAMRYWAKRGGGAVLKDGTLGFKGRNMGGTGSYSGNSKSKPKHYTAILVANARARGFINGINIRRT